MRCFVGCSFFRFAALFPYSHFCVRLQNGNVFPFFLLRVFLIGHSFQAFVFLRDVVLVYFSPGFVFVLLFEVIAWTPPNYSQLVVFCDCSFVFFLFFVLHWSRQRCPPFVPAHFTCSCFSRMLPPEPQTANPTLGRISFLFVLVPCFARVSFFFFFSFS